MQAGLFRSHRRQLQDMFLGSGLQSVRIRGGSTPGSRHGSHGALRWRKSQVDGGSNNPMCNASLELFVSERVVMAVENRQPGCKRSRDIAAVVQICALNDDIFVSRL